MTELNNEPKCMIKKGFGLSSASKVNVSDQSMFVVSETRTVFTDLLHKMNFRHYFDEPSIWFSIFDFKIYVKEK